jgi:hypothetical protein
MKSSETSTQNSTLIEPIVLPQSVREELQKTLGNLKTLLKDNPKFFNELVKECLKVGKEQYVYFNDVEKLLHAEYPDLMKYTDGKKLLQTSCRFVEELCFDSKATKELVKEWNPQTGDDYYAIREQIDHVVFDICNIRLEDGDVGVIGDTE